MKIIKTAKYRYGYEDNGMGNDPGNDPKVSPLEENWDIIIDNIIYNFENETPSLETLMIVIRYVTAVKYDLELNTAEATAIVHEVVNRLPYLHKLFEQQDAAGDPNKKTTKFPIEEYTQELRNLINSNISDINNMTFEDMLQFREVYNGLDKKYDYHRTYYRSASHKDPSYLLHSWLWSLPAIDESFREKRVEEIKQLLLGI
jgi:hypothetical protein